MSAEQDRLRAKMDRIAHDPENQRQLERVKAGLLPGTPTAQDRRARLADDIEREMAELWSDTNPSWVTVATLVGRLRRG